MFGVSIEILAVYALIGVAVFLFINKRISFDVASLILMAILVVSGILTPTEGLSGFSNPATITIACMFILSEALRNTGVLNVVGDHFLKLGDKNMNVALIVIMIGIGVISAFINNTAAVAIFIPVMIRLSRDLNVSASRLLMPLSFAAMFGGVSTLIGTSTNLLVDSIAIENNLAGFSMFEFTPLGLLFFGAGFIYLFTVGIKLIPERRQSKDLTDSFEMQNFLTDVILQPHSAFVDTPMKDSALLEDLDIDIIEIFDENESPKGDRENLKLQANDTLRVRGSAEEINKLLKREDLMIKPGEQWVDADFEEGNARLLEAVVAPESSLEGRKLKDIDFYQEYGAVLLAVRQAGEIQNERFTEITLNSGSSLLLFTENDKIQKINSMPEFVLASSIDLPDFKKEKTPVALSIIAGVVSLAAFGVIPIVESAICGVILMILSGCISSDEAYRSINWKVIFLLGGVLPLGTAMQKTGAAQLLVDTVINQFESLGPTAILSAFFFLSMMLTNLISNQATAALLAPISIEASSSLGVNPEPMLIAVTMAASLSFMTPIGYQTNTMIYGPGQYKFTDYAKVGTPLNIIFWIMGSLLIPFFWPF